LAEAWKRQLPAAKTELVIVGTGRTFEQGGVKDKPISGR